METLPVFGTEEYVAWRGQQLSPLSRLQLVETRLRNEQDAYRLLVETLADINASRRKFASTSDSFQQRAVLEAWNYGLTKLEKLSTGTIAERLARRELPGHLSSYRRASHQLSFP